MSYAYDPIEEERRKKEQSDQQQLGGESSVVSGNAPTSGQSSQNNKGSGQYVNLKNYLDTNKNQFATDLAQKTEQDFSNAQDSQAKAKEDFQSESDKGTTKLDQNNIDFVTKNPYAASLGYNQSNIGSYSQSNQNTATTQNQNTTNQTPEEINRFISQRDAIYGGPQQFAGTDYYNRAYSDLNKAKQTAQAFQSDAGRKALLDKYYGSGNNRSDYSQGQQNLDMLLFGSDPGAKNAMLEQQKRAQDLTTGFADLESELNNYSRQNALQTMAARNAARSAIGIDDSGGFTGSGPIQQILDATQKRSKELSTKYPEFVNDVTSALFNKDISKLDEETKNRLNLQDVYSLYNLDPSSSKYLSFARPEDVTQSGVTTQDELNALASLSNLAGINQQWIDPSMAGKTSNGLFNYNTDLFKQDLAAAKQNFENQRKNLYFLNYDSAGNSYIDDPDDIIALWNRSLQYDPNQPYADKRRSGMTKFFNDYIYNMEKNAGARDVLKAGRQNELMDLSDDLKADILRSYIDPFANSATFSVPNFANNGLYGRTFTQNPSWQRPEQVKGGINDYIALENAQSARGLSDYQYLKDLLKQQGKSGSDFGLPNISDEEIIDKYKKGQPVWA